MKLFPDVRDATWPASWTLWPEQKKWVRDNGKSGYQVLLLTVIQEPGGDHRGVKGEGVLNIGVVGSGSVREGGNANGRGCCRSGVGVGRIIDGSRRSGAGRLMNNPLFKNAIKLQSWDLQQKGQRLWYHGMKNQQSHHLQQYEKQYRQRNRK